MARVPMDPPRAVGGRGRGCSDRRSDVVPHRKRDGSWRTRAHRPNDPKRPARALGRGGLGNRRTQTGNSGFRASIFWPVFGPARRRMAAGRPCPWTQRGSRFARGAGKGKNEKKKYKRVRYAAFSGRGSAVDRMVTRVMTAALAAVAGSNTSTGPVPTRGQTTARTHCFLP